MDAESLGLELQKWHGTLRVAGAGAAEMAWEEATEGERGLSGR